MYQEEMKQYNIETLIGKLTVPKFKHWKDDVYKNTKWMKFKERLKPRLICYLNNINEYEKCSEGNDKKFGSKLCLVYGCKCRSEVYKISNKKSDELKNSDIFSNIVKSQWIRLNEKIENALILEKSNVFELLNNEFNYKNYFGRLSNRRLILDNTNLYKSIIFWTKNYETNIMKNLTAKLIFCGELNFDEQKIKCKYCDDFVPFNPFKKSFGKICKSCRICRNKLYYSEISQDLFKLLDCKLADNCSFFSTKNKELYLKSEKRKCYFDFTYKNKIIEFNGDMWHMNPKKYKSDDLNPFNKIPASKIWKLDKEKYQLANDNNYEIFIVWESNYKNNKEKTIKECLDFLNESS